MDNTAMLTIAGTDTKALVAFMHGACFSPTKRSFLNAIRNNHFVTWPGLTTEFVSKYLVLPEATSLGHLDQQQQNFRSTKTPSTPPNDKEDTDFIA